MNDYSDIRGENVPYGVNGIKQSPSGSDNIWWVIGSNRCPHRLDGPACNYDRCYSRRGRYEYYIRGQTIPRRLYLKHPEVLFYKEMKKLKALKKAQSILEI